VKLTAEGEHAFTAMASVHEQWVDELLGLYDKAEVGELIGKLDRVVDEIRGRSTATAMPVKRRPRR
jgi:DNA-binding MarR family transcriptional regulator